MAFGCHSVFRATRTAPSARLLRIYRALLAHFGHAAWWPGDSPFEIAVGAVLTQNTSWRNVEKAIADLKRAHLLNPARIHALSVDELLAEIKALEARLRGDRNDAPASAPAPASATATATAPAPPPLPRPLPLPHPPPHPRPPPPPLPQPHPPPDPQPRPHPFPRAFRVPMFLVRLPAPTLVWYIVTMTTKYRVALRKTHEGYSVWVPGLPGCWSQGCTQKEALENIRDAIEAYLATMIDLCKPHSTRVVAIRSVKHAAAARH